MNKITKNLKSLIYKAFESNKNSTEILKICGNWFKTGGEYRNRTDESEFCRLVPYRLANSPFYKILEQVTGIGPVTKPWQGLILPLNYTCTI